MIIVDRIENGIAVCENNGKFISIPKTNIKGKLREGAVLIKFNNGYIVDEDQTNNRKKAMFEKQKKLFGI